MAAYSQNFVMCGLTTLAFSVPVAGIFNLSGKLTVPQLSEGAPSPSQVIVTIQQNASTIYTGTAGQEGFGVTVTTAVGDAFTVALTSSATVDSGLNVVKAVVTIG
jgi:hypothetical protein